MTVRRPVWRAMQPVAHCAAKTASLIFIGGVGHIVAPEQQAWSVNCTLTHIPRVQIWKVCEQVFDILLTSFAPHSMLT